MGGKTQKKKERARLTVKGENADVEHEAVKTLVTKPGAGANLPAYY